MGDLVLLYLVHLGVARVVSKWAEGGMISETHVFPSYSNIGSHPVESQLMKALQALGLTKICWTSCWYYLALRSVRRARQTDQSTHVCSALEDDWFVTRAFTICECAHSLSRLVWESGEEVIEPLVTKRF